jgi:ABC-2 type transport system ATP-binding protein
MSSVPAALLGAFAASAVAALAPAVFAAPRAGVALDTGALAALALAGTPRFGSAATPLVAPCGGSFGRAAPAAAWGAALLGAARVSSLGPAGGPPAVLASLGALEGVHAARKSAANSGPRGRIFVLQGETREMITVEGLYKSYSGSTFAVRDVSFRVKKGEIVGFLGPNGAGKSTTLRVVAGFLGATAGKVTLAGHDIVEAPYEARAQVGYMPEAVPLYPEMRVREYLAFRAELKRVPRKQRRDAVDSAMRRARVHGVADKLIGHLSKGYRQRVGLADALVADPPILVLDEPTAGLDPNQIREVRALVRELGKEHAVLVSTHILPEVEATCDRALVISKGALVAEGTIEELRKSSRSRGVRITVSGTGDVARALATNPDVEQVTGFGLRELSPVKASLEQVFAELTEETAA